MSKIKTPVHIRVKVMASARKEKVLRVADDRYEIAVREPAENNRANARVLEILHQLYPDMRVRMVKGHHAPQKTFSVS